MKWMENVNNGKNKEWRNKLKEMEEQVERNMRRIGLTIKDAVDWCRWRDVGRAAEVERFIRPPSFTENIFHRIKIKLLLLVLQYTC